MDVEPDFLTLLQVLSDNHVEFIVIGGVSAVLQGAPVATFDLDIIHSRSEENVRRLKHALMSLGAHHREKEGQRVEPQAHHLTGDGHHLLMTNAGPIDILGQVSDGRVYEDLLAESLEFEIEGDLHVSVLSLSALISLKIATGRDKDRAMLPVLQQTLAEQQGDREPN